MRQLSTHLLLFAIVLLSGCKRDMFDPQAYEQVVTETMPVNEVDPNHTWNLTQTHTVVVTANAGASFGAQRVRILSGNPYIIKEVEILAESAIQPNGTATLFFSAPSYLQQFYAALTDAEGRCLLKSFGAAEGKVAFDSGAEAPTGQMNEPVYQTYTYLYEEDYPKPGDWDFNDLVLRIQKLPAQEPNSVRLRVTLAAAGAKKQIAAAIRLTGYSADDIESVSIEEGRTFDGAYPVKRIFIEETDLLLRGLHGEAVLNLFEDAHYALSPRLNEPEKGGTTIRMFYNTSRTPDGTKSAQIAQKILTYVVKFKTDKGLQNFTLETLDPFAIEDFNSGHWEVHTAPHKAAQVLNDFGDNVTATSNILVWALKIPSGTFRYPIEGQPLGLSKDGVLTGAYMLRDHSYGQWMANHNTSIDWFLYPTTGLIY
ncbi:MAG: LruC domain-containing protein [Prevotella sp.]|nr:LruC domain-containing protein [Prevotella sp.]MBP3789412.1 LruC domain-containing protein [Prevotella sp.]